MHWVGISCHVTEHVEHMGDCCWGADKVAMLARVARNSCIGRISTGVLLEIASALVLYLDGRQVLIMLSCFHSRKDVHC